MFEQIFESLRQTSESSLHLQQEMIKHWSQQWIFAPRGVAGASTDWSRTLQRQYVELVLELLNKHRESVNASYRAAIQVLEQLFRASDARSSDDYRHTVEDLLRRLVETTRHQLESQVGDLQSWTAKSLKVINGGVPM